MMNATDVPCGDHSKVVTPPFSFVTSSASPPATLMRQTFALPLLDVMNPIHLPSGDHRGSVADLSPRVSCRLSVPSAFATWICESHSLVAPSIAASETATATLVPSGDG